MVGHSAAFLWTNPLPCGGKADSSVSQLAAQPTNRQLSQPTDVWSHFRPTTKKDIVTAGREWLEAGLRVDYRAPGLLPGHTIPTVCTVWC